MGRGARQQPAGCPAGCTSPERQYVRGWVCLGGRGKGKQRMHQNGTRGMGRMSPCPKPSPLLLAPTLHSV